MYSESRFYPAGDRSLVMEFGNAISKEINAAVRKMTLVIRQNGVSGIMEIVPSYRSLLIIYDPLQWDYSALCRKLKDLSEISVHTDISVPKIVILPVLYGGECGPDLPYVCEHNRLSAEEVIKIHTGSDYLVYMLGFTPGFPYLGGMDERIATPRLATPRTKIYAGSVGIAGSQTGVYPIESPGGWQIIGRTPVNLFDPRREKPIMLEAGDTLRFYAVTAEEYENIACQVREGAYQID